MESAINIHISGSRTNDRQMVTISVFPSADGHISKQCMLLFKELEIPDIQEAFSVQAHVVACFEVIANAIYEDVQDCGYTAPVDLMLEVVKRKPS